ncbi:MAG: hypothetical protein V7K26_15175 [Nostoc sp.]
MEKEPIKSQKNLKVYQNSLMGLPKNKLFQEKLATLKNSVIIQITTKGG